MIGWIIIGVLGIYCLLAILSCITMKPNEDEVDYPTFDILDYQEADYCEFVRKHRKMHGKESFKYIFDDEKTTVICKECGESIDLPIYEPQSICLVPDWED